MRTQAVGLGRVPRMGGRVKAAAVACALVWPVAAHAQTGDFDIEGTRAQLQTMRAAVSQLDELIVTLDDRLSNGVRVACPLYLDHGHSFELDCAVRDGWSGAPVIVRRWGRDVLAGLLSGRMAQNGVTTALVVPADRIRGLLRD